MASEPYAKKSVGPPWTMRPVPKLKNPVTADAQSHSPDAMLPSIRGTVRTGGAVTTIFCAYRSPVGPNWDALAVHAMLTTAAKGVLLFIIVVLCSNVGRWLRGASEREKGEDSRVRSTLSLQQS